ncbi:amino acid permease [Haloferula luteola]|uniref:Amino acid permease n=1 Tax=Haloferula luteola TaxID=595692 RepID=A0A840VEZ6_9BACT|nr:hypothetical protein [Haloferula luteola]MBB5352410.1 amino acid permease [Haloferula luteola]
MNPYEASRESISQTVLGKELPPKSQRMLHSVRLGLLIGQVLLSFVGGYGVAKGRGDALLAVAMVGVFLMQVLLVWIPGRKAVEGWQMLRWATAVFFITFLGWGAVSPLGMG